jgi:hypothetical protein
MNNFIQSIQKGIQAAQHADAANKEIRDVFVELNRQIKEGIGDYQIVFDTKFREPKKKMIELVAARQAKFIGLAASSQSIFDQFTKAPRPSENAIPYIGLILRGHKKEWELGEWNQDPAGYPCRIDSDAIHLTCENKAGLVVGFEQLLSSPMVGKFLIEAKNLQATARSASKCTAVSAILSLQFPRHQVTAPERVLRWPLRPPHVTALHRFSADSP